jgi:Domain of unknown function (DUF6378)/Domain of unknown function (DUF4406)
MSGFPEHNFPAFHAAASALRDEGYTALNPAESDNGSTDKPWAYYMRKALTMLVQADEVRVLPGWTGSRGARIEVQVALWLGLPVSNAEGLPITERSLPPLRSAPPAIAAGTPQETVCQEADRLVAHDRQSTYGHPREDFARTGKIWSAILGVDVTPEQVALCMIGVKMSRECHKAKRDNAVDICGYAKCLDMVREAGK